MNDHSDKRVVLITGTSKGLGKNLAEFFLDRGYVVLGCSRGESTINSVGYTHFQIDITDVLSIQKIFQVIRSDFKRLDVLINNAVANPKVISSVLLSQDSIQKSFSTNLFAPMFFCGEAVKLMSRKKFGRIINIGSIVTRHEVGGGPLYNSSKAALIAYTRILSKEVFKLGITANVIAPSVMKTELSDNADEQKLKELLSRCAIQEYGKFSDISNIIDFVIKEESSAITGQTFYLGGA